MVMQLKKHTIVHQVHDLQKNHATGTRFSRFFFTLSAIINSCTMVHDFSVNRAPVARLRLLSIALPYENCFLLLHK